MSYVFAISASVGSAAVMNRWPESGGEAIHMSTFLSNAAESAGELASIAQLRELGLVERAAQLESFVFERLDAVRTAARGRIGNVRGHGLMWGLECVDADGAPDGALAAAVVGSALRHGVVMLSSGFAGQV